MKDKLLDRFLRYIKVDTQSDENSQTFPSTEKQFDLAKLLVQELKELGLEDAEVDKNCYVTATLKSNLSDGRIIPAVGFIAHMDTATNVSGQNVNPQVYENYQGEVITFKKNPNIKLSPEDTPYLNSCKGDTIITTDGTTLLGGDDKAGIAAIMTAVEYLLADPDIKHGDIKIGFTPDEEIGQGTKYFDIEKFGADFAFTVDGHMPPQLNKETFSADMATIEIEGKDIHPGEAKDVMINSIRIASDIVSELPADMAPETTEGHEPYLHPYELTGTVEKSTVNILLRSFKLEELNEFRKKLDKIISKTEKKYPKAKLSMTVKHQYKNMIEYLKDKPEILNCLWKSAENIGLTPEWEPIRGGTDGSRLSEMGLPTPNIYCGCENAHSTREYVSLNAMDKAVELLVLIAKNTAEIK